ncbi:hypothetical protein AVEN_173753-1 [Araneus ventricosus]|uniref:Uncharacterized protein n=1 Tax=Araneus ventricosus TaxID=182803 RepID=A0A4Y2QIA8_ARAVE|nr:hypothetical protein AVEN_173753-1 [Araneus ventricosus]
MEQFLEFFETPARSVRGPVCPQNTQKDPNPSREHCESGFEKNNADTLSIVAEVELPFSNLNFSFYYAGSLYTRQSHSIVFRFHGSLALQRQPFLSHCPVSDALVPLSLHALFRPRTHRPQLVSHQLKHCHFLNTPVLVIHSYLC